MIQPQQQHGVPGVIGAQHGLQRLTDTLTAIETGQRQQETRDTEIRTQLATQATAMSSMAATIRWQGWALAGLAVLMLTLGGMVGWQAWHPPHIEYARALGTIDATLVQTWSSLPKHVQESLTSTYGRLRLASLGWT